MLMSMTTLPISGVSFLICGLARICLLQWEDSFLDRLLKARECVRQAGLILVAELSCSMNLSTCLLRLPSFSLLLGFLWGWYWEAGWKGIGQKLDMGVEILVPRGPTLRRADAKSRRRCGEDRP
jgi:hypothetical protein